MTDQAEGVIQGLTAEGDLGAPAGCVWVKLDSSESTYLANVSFVLQGLKVDNRVRLELANGKLGQTVKSVTLLEEGVGLEAPEAESSTPETVPSKLLSSPPAPTTPPSKLHKSEGKFLTVPLSQIQESSWNPNEMDEETFHDLLQDLRVGGQYVVNPIDLFAVSHDEAGVIQYQIADGHNRFRAARKAGWKEIRAIVYDMDEDQAKVWNYRKNRERGTINPTKEGNLFQSEVDTGHTQQDIAAKYGVSQQHVSSRLRTLPLYPTGVKPSAAEEIVDKIKDPEVRETVARVAVKRRLTPEQTGEVAKRVRKDLEGKKDPPKKFVRVKAEQHAKEVKSPRFQPEPDHEFQCPRCRTNQVVFCGGPGTHRVVPVQEEDDED